MNALIIAKNNFLALGVKTLVEKISNDINVCISKSDYNSLHRYDVIFVEIYRHEFHLCHYEFRNINSDAKVIFITNFTFDSSVMKISPCFYEAQFIYISEPKENLSQKIKNLLTREFPTNKNKVNPCLRCDFKYITASQLLIILGMRQGYSVKRMSTALGVSTNTIFSQIERIKKNFLIRNHAELICFTNENIISCNAPVRPKKNHKS